MDALVLAAWTAGAYVMGSIPFGLLLGLVLFRVDIREHGSRNLGATNAARVLGRGRFGRTVLFFLVVFVLDAAKGFVPAFLAREFGGLPLGLHAGLFAAAGTVAGHMASVFLRFKGGKGVAVSAGALAALVPLPTAVAAGVWLLAVAVTRYVSVGSILAAVALPATVFALNDDLVWKICCGLLGALVLVKHRSNMMRLLRGTESRVGGRKTPPEKLQGEGTEGV